MGMKSFVWEDKSAFHEPRPKILPLGQKKVFKGKIYLTLSNYHFNDNLCLKLLIAIIYPSNYKNNNNISPQCQQNDEITLTKIKTKY
jgi:hypothetical protein